MNEEKGLLGENVIYNECMKLLQNKGLIYHSLKIPMDTDLPGNIHKDEQNRNVIGGCAPETEIDILVVTENNIFVVEVKTYRANNIELKSDGIYGCYKTDKSPIHQNEMHCRHFYSKLLSCIPNGDPSYIKPIVVFTDKCKVTDNRSAFERSYIPITNIDNFVSSIRKLDKPNDYRLDLQYIEKTLSSYSFTRYMKG